MGSSITLTLSPSLTNSDVLISPLTTPATIQPLYIKRRLRHPHKYVITLVDRTTAGVIYGELSCEGPLKKNRGLSVTLHQPELNLAIIPNEGKLRRWDWTFDWEDRRFRWTKNQPFSKDITCHYLPSKYDAPIAVCLFEYNNTLANRSSTAPSMTLLDYNINRIEISDVKGLEVVLILSVSAFLDLLIGDVLQDEMQRLELEEATNNEQRRRQNQEAAECKRKELQDLERETLRLQKLQNDWIEETERQRLELVEAETQRLREQIAVEDRARAEEQRRIDQETNRLLQMFGPPWPGRRNIPSVGIQEH